MRSKAIDRGMSIHIFDQVGKVSWLIAASLFLVALLVLVAVSVEQVYAVVIKSLLISNGSAKLFWVGASIAAAIPVGFLIVYSWLLLALCRRQVREVISSRHSADCR